MKILVLSSHTNSLFWFRLDMMKDFVRLGHEVFAVGSEDEEVWKVRFDSHNITYIKIPVERNGLSPISDLRTLISLVKLIKRVKPDKIFAYQAKTVIYGSIAAEICKVTDVYLLIAGLGSIFRGEKLRSKIIKFLMVFEYKIACLFSKVVIFQNNDDKNEFIEHKIVQESKCFIINGSGVNVEHFRLTALPKGTTFLFIGRLLRDKGVYEYLQSCQTLKEKYPDIRCILIGPYDTNPSALKESELTPFLVNGSVEYYGEQSDVRPFIEMCNVYVLPSYHEGTPKSVLEAMAMGRPIITSNAPGCRETVVVNENGFLVKTQDAHDLSEKMERFIGNEELQKKFGNASRKIAESKYDVKKVNESIMKIMKLV